MARYNRIWRICRKAIGAGNKIKSEFRGVLRRTLKFIKEYPGPHKLYTQLVSSEGWPYKSNFEFYRKRDRALVAVLYLLALRISEALRLTIEQFSRTKDYILVSGIQLSKTKTRDKPRKHQFREEGFLPLKGPRTDFTNLVLDYLDFPDLNQELQDSRLWPFGRKRAYQIVAALLDIPCHWLRAYGENFLYDFWSKDLLAVSDYMKIDIRTLQEYIRKSYKKYPVR